MYKEAALVAITLTAINLYILTQARHLAPPVCGQDGVMYHTQAQAEKATGLPIACIGECPCSEKARKKALKKCLKGCKRDKEFKACSSTGKSFRNKCALECFGEELACAKKCPCVKSCACPQVYDPVCGSDNITYSNACELSCSPELNNITVACKGQCPCRYCKCPKLKRPVCGVDNITYCNACLADCIYMKIMCEGECPCKEMILN